MAGRRAGERAPDPGGFLTTLDGRTIRNKGTTNVNYAYFNRPRYNRLIGAASQLHRPGAGPDAGRTQRESGGLRGFAEPSDGLEPSTPSLP